MPKCPITKTCAKVKKAKVSMVTTNNRGNMSEMRTITVTKTSTKISMVTIMIGVGQMFPLRIGKLLRGAIEVV